MTAPIPVDPPIIEPTPVQKTKLDTLVEQALVDNPTDAAGAAKQVSGQLSADVIAAVDAATANLKVELLAAIVGPAPDPEPVDRPKPTGRVVTPPKPVIG